MGIRVRALVCVLLLFVRLGLGVASRLLLNIRILGLQCFPKGSMYLIVDTYALKGSLYRYFKA